MIINKKITPRMVWTKVKSLLQFPVILGDFLRFKKGAGAGRFSLSLIDAQPCLHDKVAMIVPERHYLYHPAWAARVLAETKPAKHVDISSAFFFSTLVSAFIPIDFYDYRPFEAHLDNLSSGQADLLQLPFADNSLQSLSCMHTVEHVGLGRYGDPLDYDGDLKAIKELKRVLAPGGNLLFVTPISGQPRIQFNANRIFSYDQIMEYFSGLTLREFTLIPDTEKDGNLVRHASKALSDAQRHGCGCFWFTK